MFKKNKELDFYCLIPEIFQLAPIVPASEIKKKWFENAQKDLAKKSKDKYHYSNYFRHIAKCPGIYQFLNYGWVLTAYQDIVIKTNGNKDFVEWKTPINQKNLVNNEGKIDAIDFMPKEQMANYFDNWDNSINTIIKYNSLWRCKIPKGYLLHEGPVPYIDEKRFTVIEGVHSPNEGPAQLNPFLKWHILDDEILIKAGTPISCYYLIPQKQPTASIRVATNDDIAKDRLLAMEYSRRFFTDKGKSKCIFAKFFK